MNLGNAFIQHDWQRQAASGYFYFESGEAADWLDHAVNVPTVNSLSVAEWIAEFDRLKKVNAEIIGAKGLRPAPKRNRFKVDP